MALKKSPLDQRFETVSGDPAKSGALYVIRIHAEAGYIIMPHTHPEDENIVVVKGTWALGMGDRFNRQALEPMELGTYGLVAKKMAHFALSKTDTIIQVHGVGPFTTQWVVPMYEITDKGVFLETFAAEPGRPTPTSPPGCFVLKLGTRVRCSYGEGVVAGAQCTPGHPVSDRKSKQGPVLGAARRIEHTISIWEASHWVHRESSSILGSHAPLRGQYRYTSCAFYAMKIGDTMAAVFGVKKEIPVTIPSAGLTSFSVRIPSVFPRQVSRLSEPDWVFFRSAVIARSLNSSGISVFIRSQWRPVCIRFH